MTFNGGGYTPSNPFSVHNSYPMYSQPISPVPQMPMPTMQQPQMQPQMAQAQAYQQPMQQMQQAQQAQQQMAQPMQNIPPKTNKVFVLNKEAAGNALAEYNSDYVYFDQDNPILYNVVTDMQGKKTITMYKVEPYSEPVASTPAEIDTTQFVTQEQFKALEAQIAALKATPKTVDSKPEVKKTEPKKEVKAEPKTE